MVEHWAHQLLILSYFQRGISGRFAELPLRGLQSGMVPGRWSACSVAQTCSTLATLWTGPPGSSVHGILQARILVWVATPSSREIVRTQGLNPCLLHLLHRQADSLVPPRKPWQVEGLQQMSTKGIRDRTRIMTRQNLSDKLFIRDIWAPGGPAWK